MTFRHREACTSRSTVKAWDVGRVRVGAAVEFPMPVVERSAARATRLGELY
jgi:hypothetical protein